MLENGFYLLAQRYLLFWILQGASGEKSFSYLQITQKKRRTPYWGVPR